MKPKVKIVYSLYYFNEVIEPMLKLAEKKLAEFDFKNTDVEGSYDIPFEIGLFLKLMGINNSPVPIIKGISKLKILFSMDKGLRIDTNPNTDNILNKLEPIIFPTEIECSFLTAANTEVTSSGKDVPKATTDIPIIKSLTPMIFAKPMAPSIKYSDPK